MIWIITGIIFSWFCMAIWIVFLLDEKKCLKRKIKRLEVDAYVSNDHK